MTANSKQAGHLRIGGFVPFTTVDYPGALAAVIFCQGCPLRCVYCHNPTLLPTRQPNRIPWTDIWAHLARRKGLLDAVVFSGGEPLAQAALVPAMTAVKMLGYRIGLHTSGIAPSRLGQVLHLLDWVGFDMKAPFDKYDMITRGHGSGANVRQSLTMLAEKGIETEVRTTIWPGATDGDDVRRVADDIKMIGIESFVVQEARDTRSRAPVGGDIFHDAELQKELAQGFPGFMIRRAA